MKPYRGTPCGNQTSLLHRTSSLRPRSRCQVSNEINFSLYSSYPHFQSTPSGSNTVNVKGKEDTTWITSPIRWSLQFRNLHTPSRRTSLIFASLAIPSFCVPISPVSSMIRPCGCHTSVQNYNCCCCCCCCHHIVTIIVSSFSLYMLIPMPSYLLCDTFIYTYIHICLYM